MDLIFLTGNEEKVREARQILGEDINILQNNIDIDEVQEIDGKKVVLKKVQSGFEILKKPLIVEDTSLYIKAWNNLPGALDRWFMKTVGNNGIIKMLENFEDRTATAQTLVAFYDGAKVEIFEGEVTGQISKSVVGENGFGWDKIFIPEGSDKTQAQMSAEEKNKISSRKIALEKLRNYFSEN